MFGIGRKCHRMLSRLKSIIATDTSNQPDSVVQPSVNEAEVAAIQSRQKMSIEYTIRKHWETIDILDQSRLPALLLSCPLCGYANMRDKYQILVSNCIFLGGRLERYVCPQCEGIFGPHKMLELSPEALSAEIAMHYQIYSEGDSTHLEKRAFHSLEPTRQGNYLNYGCGDSWSKTIHELREDGYNVYGFEPFAGAGSPHIHVNWDSLAGHRFDGLFCSNVLEHIRYPEDELKKMKSLLKPSGKIAFSTPCFAYSFEYTRFHLFFYTGKSFDYLANKCGFRVVKEESDPSSYYNNRVIALDSDSRNSR